MADLPLSDPEAWELLTILEAAKQDELQRLEEVKGRLEIMDRFLNRLELLTENQNPPGAKPKGRRPAGPIVGRLPNGIALQRARNKPVELRGRKVTLRVTSVESSSQMTLGGY